MTTLPEVLAGMLDYFWVVLLILLLSLYTSTHILLNKTDSRAAFGWIAVVLLLPILGVILYFLFGINRVQLRAKKLNHAVTDIDADMYHINDNLIPGVYENLNRVSYNVTKCPLVGGNTAEILDTGNKAYASMIDSINSAKRCIYLSVYLFKVDDLGKQFITALINARKRGVATYVLIDGIGEYYSKVKARYQLEKSGVYVKRFLPPKLFPFNVHINLRNHRKLLIVDDELGYVGGMNISNEYVSHSTSSFNDIHFKLTGPIIQQLKNVFQSDWNLTDHRIDEKQIGYLNLKGPMLCRTISDGPGEHLGHLLIVLFSAINTAVNQIVIMTPYFLPNKELTRALQVAALRGVEVIVLLPEENNLKIVHWANRHMLANLLVSGVKIFYNPPPFDHSKLFIVDNSYCLIGSTNIDPRSLRLNYEVGVEVYDENFVAKLKTYVKKIIDKSRLIEKDELDKRHLLLKLRDAIAWLFSPYL